jgi:hypothetical protein
MSGEGCSCAGPAPTAAAPSSAATPCGSGAYSTVIIWDPLSLPGSTQERSFVVPTRGGNAFDFIAIAMNALGSIQTSIQAQVSCDGINWTNAGSAHQITALGYSVSALITGNGSSHIRLVASNQVANLLIFSIALRIYCN